VGIIRLVHLCCCGKDAHILVMQNTTSQGNTVPKPDWTRTIPSNSGHISMVFIPKLVSGNVCLMSLDARCRTVSQLSGRRGLRFTFHNQDYSCLCRPKRRATAVTIATLFIPSTFARIVLSLKRGCGSNVALICLPQIMLSLPCFPKAQSPHVGWP